MTYSFSPSGIEVPESERNYRITDGHFHLLNFVQATERKGLAKFLPAMDQAGVDSAMISGMGVCKKWSGWDKVEPKYYLDDDSRVYPYSATDTLVYKHVTALSTEEQERFHPFICGFDPTDRNAVDHIRRMIDMHPGFWQGIGEVFARHDDLTALMYGEPGRANHVALKRVYEFAATADMPVLIHSDITSAWHTQKKIYLHELEEAVAQNGDTKFIWCHAGMSRRLTVPGLTEVVWQLLTKYPNLHVDLSWVVYDLQLVRNDVPNEQWVSLINNFPTRFTIGSDVVAVAAKYVPAITRYYVLLDSLEENTAYQVAKHNFIDLLPKKPATVAPAEVRSAPIYPADLVPAELEQLYALE